MSDGPRTYASVCVYGDELDPQAISQALGVPPSRSGRRGDPLRKGRTVDRGFWILTTRDAGVAAEPGDSSAHLRALAAWPGLDQARLAALHEQYLVRVFVFWELQDGNGGPELMPDALAWLVRIGAELHVDVYVGE